MKLSFLGAASEVPNRVALVVDGKEFSYSELSREVRQAMSRIRSLVYQETSSRPVALVAKGDVNSVTTLYGAMALRIPVVLIHPQLSPAERAKILESTSPFLQLAGEPSAEGGHFPEDAPRIEGSGILAIVFTSGTSGESRGISLSRAAFIASAEASAANLGWHNDDRWLLCVPFSHVSGLSILTRCLIARRTVVLGSADGTPFSAAQIARTVSRDRVTLLSLVPAQLTSLLDLEPAWNPPPFVRAILLGGAPASPRLLTRAVERGYPVLTTYGLTEACSQVTTQRDGTINRGEQGSGDPLPGISVRIVNGIIQVRSSTLMSGYFDQQPSLTPITHDGWLVTQDCGEFDSVGRLHVLGRRDDVIITGGEKVHPTEVEMALEACDGISAACVFGVPDEVWGNVVSAALEVSSTQPDDDTLLKHLARHLASYKRPRRIARLGSFPRRPNSKVDRRAVIAQVREVLTPLERR